MKRNVLKAGRSSLAISIPKSFVDSNRIVQGQEVDVNFHGNTMTMSCSTPVPMKKILDLQDLFYAHDGEGRLHVGVDLRELFLVPRGHA